MLQTSCTLALYNVTKENLILVAKISKESSDTNQKHPVDLLKREKVWVDKTERCNWCCAGCQRGPRQYREQNVCCFRDRSCISQFLVVVVVVVVVVAVVVVVVPIVVVVVVVVVAPIVAVVVVAAAVVVPVVVAAAVVVVAIVSVVVVTVVVTVVVVVW